VLESSDNFIIANDLKANGDFSSGSEVPCVEGNREKWKATALTNMDLSHSSVGGQFLVAGKEVKVVLEGKRYGGLKFRVKDNNAYLDISDCGVVDGGWHEFTTRTCSVSLSDFEGYFKIDLMVKTNLSRGVQFGEDDLRSWLLVDANLNEWNAPNIYRDNSKIENEKSQMIESDARQYNDYEYAYLIEPIDGREVKLTLDFEALDGITPNNDISIEFCSEGRYLSSKLRDTILIGCYNDNTPKTLVSGEVQKLTIKTQ